MRTVLCLLAAVLVTGCVTTTADDYYPQGREIRLEKGDARYLVGEWRGKWMNEKYSNTGDTDVVARFVPLPAEGLYALGSVMGEFVYHNPPGVFTQSSVRDFGKSYKRWPQRDGYAAGQIVNDGVWFDRLNQLKAREHREGCLMLYYPPGTPGTHTPDGYRFFAWYERCDPALKPILAREGSPSPLAETTE